MLATPRRVSDAATYTRRREITTYVAMATASFARMLSEVGYKDLCNGRIQQTGGLFICLFVYLFIYLTK